MKEDLITTILETEKTIEQRLKAEEEKIGRWLKERRREIEQEKAAELETLAASHQRAREKAAERAEARVAALIRHTDNTLRMLSDLDDEAVQRLVGQAIKRIRPGEKNDRQDVEN